LRESVPAFSPRASATSFTRSRIVICSPNTVAVSHSNISLIILCACTLDKRTLTRYTRDIGTNELEQLNRSASMETLGTAQAARLLGVSAKTVGRYCEQGLLDAERKQRGWLGRYRWLISRESVERLMKQAPQE